MTDLEAEPRGPSHLDSTIARIENAGDHYTVLNVAEAATNKELRAALQRDLKILDLKRVGDDNIVRAADAAISLYASWYILSDEGIRRVYALNMHPNGNMNERYNPLDGNLRQELIQQTSNLSESNSNSSIAAVCSYHRKACILEEDFHRAITHLRHGGLTNVLAGAEGNDYQTYCKNILAQKERIGERLNRHLDECHLANEQLRQACDSLEMALEKAQHGLWLELLHDVRRRFLSILVERARSSFYLELVVFHLKQYIKLTIGDEANYLLTVLETLGTKKTALTVANTSSSKSEMLLKIRNSLALDPATKETDSCSCYARAEVKMTKIAPERKSEPVALEAPALPVELFAYLGQVIEVNEIAPNRAPETQMPEAGSVVSDTTPLPCGCYRHHPAVDPPQNPPRTKDWRKRPDILDAEYIWYCTSCVQDVQEAQKKFLAEMSGLTEKEVSNHPSTKRLHTMLQLVYYNHDILLPTVHTVRTYDWYMTSGPPRNSGSKISHESKNGHQDPSSPVNSGLSEKKPGSPQFEHVHGESADTYELSKPLQPPTRQLGKVLYDFFRPEYVGLKVDDVVEILEETTDKHCIVLKDDERVLMPSNYLERMAPVTDTGLWGRTVTLQLPSAYSSSSSSSSSQTGEESYENLSDSSHFSSEEILSGELEDQFFAVPVIFLPLSDLPSPSPKALSSAKIVAPDYQATTDYSSRLRRTPPSDTKGQASTFRRLSGSKGLSYPLTAPMDPGTSTGPDTSVHVKPMPESNLKKILLSPFRRRCKALKTV